MATNDKRPIVVKRIKKIAGGAHGGAWKIAYADFVTAMMAFFLLMWLLGSTSKEDLAGISEYFKSPLKIAMSGGSNSGESSSMIKGGGQDATRSKGEMRKGEVKPEKKIEIKITPTYAIFVTNNVWAGLVDLPIKNTPTPHQARERLNNIQTLCALVFP